MLEVACDRAQAVVLNQAFFSLDSDKFKRFTAMLNAPPGPNLERLLAVDVPWGAVPEQACVSATCSVLPARTEAVAVPQDAGLRALWVHASHNRGRQFYEQYGFQVSLQHPMALMLRLSADQAGRRGQL